MDELPELVIEGGISVGCRTELSLDWASIKTLVESGVPLRDVAAKFKTRLNTVKARMKKEGWLTPRMVEGMRKEIVARQREIYKRSGKAADINQIKAEIWQERVEQRNERIHQIVDKALNGIRDEDAARMLRTPLSLLHLTQASRLITGEEKLEAQQGAQVAVNVNFLRSQRPVDIVVEAEPYEASREPGA